MLPRCTDAGDLKTADHWRNSPQSCRKRWADAGIGCLVARNDRKRSRHSG